MWPQSPKRRLILRPFLFFSSNFHFFIQSGRIELPTETYLIVPDSLETEDLGVIQDSETKQLHRIYKSKLLTENLNFENVVKGSDYYLEIFCNKYEYNFANFFFSKITDIFPGKKRKDAIYTIA